MATVLIIGASKGIGLETVRKALHAGYHVKALSRSAHDMAIDHPNLEKISASATDANSMKQAITGCDTVITAIGIGPTFQPVTLFSESTRIIIDAMKQQGIKRLIAVTGIGAGNSKGVGGLLYTKIFQPLFIGTIYEDKDREEKLIMQSGLDWTIVRPGFLTRHPEKGTYKVLTEPKDWKGGVYQPQRCCGFSCQTN